MALFPNISPSSLLTCYCSQDSIPLNTSTSVVSKWHDHLTWMTTFTWQHVIPVISWWMGCHIATTFIHVWQGSNFGALRIIPQLNVDLTKVCWTRLGNRDVCCEWSLLGKMMSQITTQTYVGQGSMKTSNVFITLIWYIQVVVGAFIWGGGG